MKVIFIFLAISCWSTFRGILGRSFLERLNALASSIYLKVAYHDTEGSTTIVSFDVDEAKRVEEIVQKDILALTVASIIEGVPWVPYDFNLNVSIGAKL